MKSFRIILLLCACLAAPFVSAENSSDDFYFPEGMTWTVSVISDYGCNHKTVLVLQGDTLINSKTYHNVRLLCEAPLVIPIAADGKKIYAHIYDRDILLYDFGLEVGDSILHYGYINFNEDVSEDRRFNEDSAYIYVSEVDSITLLDGRRAKCLHYKDRRYQDEYYIRTDIEYVGCSHGGLFSIIDVPLQTTCGSNACCCSLNGELIYEDYAGLCALMDLHSALPKEEEIALPSATKFLRDGQLLINHNGNTYNANGVRIRSRHSLRNRIRLPDKSASRIPSCSRR